MSGDRKAGVTSRLSVGGGLTRVHHTKSALLNFIADLHILLIAEIHSSESSLLFRSQNVMKKKQPVDLVDVIFDTAYV